MHRQRLIAASRFAAVAGADLLKRIPILAERFRLARHEKRKVGLIIRINAGHDFDVRRLVIAQVAIPCISKFVIPPRPLLFPRRDVVIGNMNDAGVSGVIIAAKKILP